MSGFIIILIFAIVFINFILIYLFKKWNFFVNQLPLLVSTINGVITIILVGFYIFFVMAFTGIGVYDPIGSGSPFSLYLSLGIQLPIIFLIAGIVSFTSGFLTERIINGSVQGIVFHNRKYYVIAPLLAGTFLYINLLLLSANPVLLFFNTIEGTFENAYTSFQLFIFFFLPILSFITLILIICLLLKKVRYALTFISTSLISFLGFLYGYFYLFFFTHWDENGGVSLWNPSSIGVVLFVLLLLVGYIIVHKLNAALLTRQGLMPAQRAQFFLLYIFPGLLVATLYYFLFLYGYDVALPKEKKLKQEIITQQEGRKYKVTGISVNVDKEALFVYPKLVGELPGEYEFEGIINLKKEFYSEINSQGTSLLRSDARCIVELETLHVTLPSETPLVWKIPWDVLFDCFKNNNLKQFNTAFASDFDSIRINMVEISAGKRDYTPYDFLLFDSVRYAIYSDKYQVTDKEGNVFVEGKL